MKSMMCLVSVCMCSICFSQQVISVTTDKTSSLIFPFPILHIDRGTKDILVQEVKESDNVLLLKAGCRNFHATNLSVLTNDGSIYSFTISYDSLPVSLVYKVPVQMKASIETYANGIIDNPGFIRRIRDRSWNISSRITGIYIKDETMYYQLQLVNDSPIDYDIDYIRFYIKDKIKSKRTASQEIELKPVYTAGNNRHVTAGTSDIIVIALDKFTIPDRKDFIIEAGEKNGGRNLRMRIRNKDLLKAVMLPDLR